MCLILEWFDSNVWPSSIKALNFIINELSKLLWNQMKYKYKMKLVYKSRIIKFMKCIIQVVIIY